MHSETTVIPGWICSGKHAAESFFFGPRYLRYTKRVLDILGAAILLAVFSPLMLVIALLVRLTSSGPAIFKQRREGRYGTVFIIFKFRTMRVEHEDDKQTVLKKGDYRLTCLGRYLRQTHLDELPQLFNVLLGDMSLVGPRPRQSWRNSQLSAELRGYGVRHFVKPGVTGLAQVTLSRKEICDRPGESLECDLACVSHPCMRNDLQILWRTCFAVLKRNGA